MSKKDTVNANPTVAGKNWWLDPYAKAEMHRTIRALHREGVSQLEIARRTGVSDRSVNRILNRESHTFLCGSIRTQKKQRPCTLRVRHEGDRCFYHQGT